MINLSIQTTKDEYCGVRDLLCEALVGTIGFIDNEIIVSDKNQDKNIVELYISDCTEKDIRLFVNWDHVDIL